MDFLELAKTRRSVRGFTQRPVSDETLTTLLEAAQAAPSAGNCQPWHFYVIKDSRIIRDIAQTACKQAFLQTAPVVIGVCADIRLTTGRYGQRGQTLYCLQDTAAAIQNILLCAHSAGLGACWCGAFDEREVSRILKLSGSMRPVALLPIGYPAEDPKPRDRRPIQEIATFLG